MECQKLWTNSIFPRAIPCTPSQYMHITNMFLPKELRKNVLKTILFLFSRRIIPFLCAAFEGPPSSFLPFFFPVFFFFFVGNRMLPDADFFFRKSGKGKGGKKCSFAFFPLGLGPSSFFPPPPTANFQSSFLFCSEDHGKKRALLQFQIDFVSLGKTGLGNGALVSNLLCCF